MPDKALNFAKAARSTGYKPYVAPHKMAALLNLENLVQLPVYSSDENYSHVGVFSNIFRLLDEDQLAKDKKQATKDLRTLRFSGCGTMEFNADGSKKVVLQDIERAEKAANGDPDKLAEVRNMALKYLNDNKFIKFRDEDYDLAVKLGIVDEGFSFVGDRPVAGFGAS